MLITELLAAAPWQDPVAADSGSSEAAWNLALRWIHVVAGITWIGLLYFFNFINGAFQAQLDADAKRQVVPQLMPRALFWFRWGAAFTWLTGIALFYVVYMMGNLISYPNDGGLTGRALWIMVGMLFGTIMAFNVWFIIWPAQKQIIPKVRDGEAPDGALVKRATMASKINTYLSVPLILLMVSNHFPTIYGDGNYAMLGGLILVGLIFVWIEYKFIAPSVKGM